MGVARTQSVDDVHRIGRYLERRGVATANPDAIAIQPTDQRDIVRGSKLLGQSERIACAAERAHFISVQRQQGVAVAEHGKEIFIQLSDARTGINQPPLVKRQAC
ncbi:hypothetical protein D3C71_1876640 [compost metagenome]